jgi:rSAM/selenodomain-associated transferase 1
VFLKWPEPGAAKTRLAPALGAEAAARLYRRLAEAGLRATRPEGREYERLLCYAPEGARERVASWLPGEALWAQPEGDLGRRMASAFDEGFRRGADRVALVGTDIPWITRELVARSFEALAPADLVLGPARDGGYYLVAQKEPHPQLFSGIAWSTPGVLAATCDRAAARGLAVHLLEPLHDLDTLGDLRATWERLDPLIAGDPELREKVARAIGRPRGGPEVFGGE